MNGKSGCAYVCVCVRPSAVEVGALGCNGILPARLTVAGPCVRGGGVPFDLVSAAARPECTSDTLASFVVQSCGSHFIYWGFQLQPIQRRRGEGVCVSVGVYVGGASVFYQPATNPSPPQNQI